MTAPAPPCHLCGRDVPKMRMFPGGPTYGRRRVPHRCPHGKPCAAGHRLLGLHANHVPRGGPCACARCATRNVPVLCLACNGTGTVTTAAGPIACPACVDAIDALDNVNGRA